jgi:Ser/Thr protein kinase RdoA (MazF antagonist)
LPKGPPHSVVRKAIEQYGIRGYQCTLLQNDRQAVFRIRSTNTKRRNSPNDYVLRIYHRGEKSSAAIQSQFRWLGAILRETDLTVPEPITNRHGDYVTSIELNGVSKGFCTVTRWVPGRRYFHRSGPGVETLRQVGRIMAQLHVHGLDFQRRERIVCPRWDLDGLFSSNSPWYPANQSKITPDMQRIFARVMHLAKRAMKYLGTGASVFGLIHGDLIQANYLLNHGKISVIDFADFGRGFFLYDMAVTLLMLRQFARYPQQRSAFLCGYAEARSLSADHRSLLDTFVAVRATVLARWVVGATSSNAADIQWAHQTISWIAEWTGPRT